jgi:hypothetical protein
MPLQPHAGERARHIGGMGQASGNHAWYHRSALRGHPSWLSARWLSGGGGAGQLQLLDSFPQLFDFCDDASTCAAGGSGGSGGGGGGGGSSAGPPPGDRGKPIEGPATGSRGPLKVVAMSLYGSSPQYTWGALRNADIIKEAFPDWQLWVYMAGPGAATKGLQARMGGTHCCLIILLARTAACSQAGLMHASNVTLRVQCTHMELGSVQARHAAAVTASGSFAGHAAPCVQRHACRRTACQRVVASRAPMSSTRPVPTLAANPSAPLHGPGAPERDGRAARGGRRPD